MNHRDATATKAADCMWSRYRHTESHDAPSNQSRTWPGKMMQGIGYATDRRHGVSCTRKTGTEYSKWADVIDEIRADRPAILLINATGIGGPNHYVVIEGADKRQYHYTRWGSWHNRNVRYLVNFGHHDTQTWTYVRDHGETQHKLNSSFSIYLVNLR